MRSRMSQPNRTPQLRICSLSIPRSGERMDNLFSTHPSTENRIAALEQLAAQMGVIPHFDIRCGHAKANPSCLFGFADLLGRLLCRLLRLLCNAEVFEFFTGFDSCREPARRQSASRPAFAWIFRIPLFPRHPPPPADPFVTQLVRRHPPPLCQ